MPLERAINNISIYLNIYIYIYIHLRRGALSVCPCGDPGRTPLRLEVRHSWAPIRGQTLRSPQPNFKGLFCAYPTFPWRRKWLSTFVHPRSRHPPVPRHAWLNLVGSSFSDPPLGDGDMEILLRNNTIGSLRSKVLFKCFQVPAPGVWRSLTAYAQSLTKSLQAKIP